jgi:hypothetical protein
LKKLLFKILFQIIYVKAMLLIFHKLEEFDPIYDKC